MAEEKAKKPAPAKSKQTRRVILTGFELTPKAVADALAKQSGFNQEKILKQLGSDGKAVTVWVEIGKGNGTTKKAAIESVVGDEQPGKFRAPGESAWKGGIAKRKPEKIVLDVEDLD